jgi:hypothetical protein
MNILNIDADQSGTLISYFLDEVVDTIVFNTRYSEAIAKSISPKYNRIDQSQLKKKYDYVFITGSFTKMNNDLCWSHWGRSDDFPSKDKNFDNIYNKTWGPGKQHQQQYYSYIFENIVHRVDPKKVIFVDICDRAIYRDGKRWFDSKGYKIDYVLKREYRRSHQWEYDDTVIPFPYFTFDDAKCHDLYEADFTNYNPGNNECFWIGSDLFRIELGMRDEWVNRYDIIKALDGRNNFKMYKQNVGAEEYKKLFKHHKMFLHLNGTGHLCNRFFEGCAQSCLMMMQENDVVFPFGEYITDETIFYGPEDLDKKVNKLFSDYSLYFNCLKKQNEVLKEYYSREKIKYVIKQIL